MGSDLRNRIRTRFEADPPLTLAQVLKEEYESLLGAAFPSSYRLWALQKDHLRNPAGLLIRLAGAPAGSFWSKLGERLCAQVRQGLLDYAANARSVLSELSSISPFSSRADEILEEHAETNQPPEALLKAIVEALNHWMKEEEILPEKSLDSFSAALSNAGITNGNGAENLRPLPPDLLPFVNRVVLEQEFPDQFLQVNETLAGVYSHFADRKLAALCLSGGGIRSASFALGIVQCLARLGLLERFHYLSTVSGGGYLGSWLTAWIHRHPGRMKGAVAELANLNPGPVLEPEPEPIRHLRAYSNYLTPKMGLLSADTWTLVATSLRNLLLTWLVLLPLIAVVLMIPRFCVAVVSGPRNATGLWISFVLGVLAISSAIAYMVRHRPSEGSQTSQRHFLLGFLFPSLFSGIALTVHWAWFRDEGLDVETQLTALAAMVPGLRALGLEGSLPVFLIFGLLLHILGSLLWLVVGLLQPRPKREGAKSVGQGAGELVIVVVTGLLGGWLLWLGAVKFFPNPRMQVEYYVCFAFPLYLTLFLLTVTLFAGLSSRWTDDQDREWWARSGAWILIAVVGWIGISTLVIFGPVWLCGIPQVVGSLGGLAGLLTLTLGHSSGTAAVRNGGAEKKGLAQILLEKLLSLAAPLFAAFLVILISALTTLLVSWFGDRTGQGIDWRLYDPVLSGWGNGVFNHLRVLRQAPALFILALAAGLAAFGTLMAWLVNTNKFSLHAMYRNRLIRAYLGASNNKRNPNLFTGFDERDNITMLDLWPKQRDSDPERRSLLHIINIALNLVSGEKLAWQQRKADTFTVSPLHAGNCHLGYRRTDHKNRRYGGFQGISLGTAVTISGAAASPNMGYHSSPVVTFLLTLFNVRLGWWLGNPGKPGQHTYQLPAPRLAVRPIVEETLGLTNDKNPYVYLSDGGHFDNLGIYEMVLRRCRFIVVSDASQDPRCSFEDLGSAVRKIRIDLGVPIHLSRPLRIFPRSDDPEQNRIGRYCALGSIQYSCMDGTSPDDDGVLIYLKPSFYGDEPRDIYQYARLNPSFPHESTADQFFNESQLESYRMLGSYAMQQICEGFAAGDLGSLENHIRSVYLRD